MTKRAVLSGLGHDRIGVADELSRALESRGIEIEDHRMTALGGRFALIMLVTGKKGDVDGLKQHLEKLGADLGVHLQLDVAEAARAPKTMKAYWIESYSAGPSGIAAVTGILRKYDVNIEDLQTETSTILGSWDAISRFHMTARLKVPSSCSLEALRRELHEAEVKRDLDIVLKPAASALV